MTGWRGLWLDGSADHVADVQENYAEIIDAGRLEIREAMVTAENIDSLIKPASGAEVDLLSIDIDYNDYWVWRALTLRPRVIVIEYNATIRPPVAVTTPYDPTRSWDKTSFYGASLSALEKLGREKGYSLVGCCYSGVNAFFVRDDLIGDKFCAPFTAENHYEPPRYFLR